jgi:hypothetical protein
LAHTYYVELIILETIRVSSALASLGSVSNPESRDTNNGGGTDGLPPQGYSDLSYLWQTVLAISACTSGLLSLPSDFSDISFLQWEQLAGCIVILSQLESIEDPRINRAHARSVVDLPIVLDRIVEKLSQTAGEAGEQGHVDGVFTQLAEGFRAFRTSIQTRAGQPVNQPGAGGGVSACEGSTTFAPEKGYFMNNRFWMDQLFVGSSRV